MSAPTKHHMHTMVRQVSTSHVQATGILAGTRVNCKIHSCLVYTSLKVDENPTNILTVILLVFFRAKIAHSVKKTRASQLKGNIGRISIHLLAGTMSTMYHIYMLQPPEKPTLLCM